jgi:1,4-alpha-glucan branching enzyme
MATMAQSASVSDMTQQQSPVLVRFVFLNPGARSVALAGDFNGWSPIQTPLQRTGAGAWTATVTVKPGRYHYMFVVDGRQWLTDPSATEVTDDGFGAENAVLEVGTTF